MADSKLLAFSTGIEDAATQRAVRALERALNTANSAISALQSAPAGSGVPTTRLISTIAPLAGGGSLAADLTLTVATFGSGASGVVPASGGGTANFLRADGSWAAPGSSGVPTTRLINTTAPLSGGGDLTADRTLSIAANGISNALFRQGAGTSVVGVTGGVAANVADIAAAADSTVLARLAGALGFADVATIVATFAPRGNYGDGSDGALHFDGTTTITLGANNDGATIVPSANVYTLVRDLYATRVVIDSGVTVNGAGFFIFASVSANGPGTFSCDGRNGGNGTTVSGTGGANTGTNRYNTNGGGGGSGGTGNGTNSAGGVTNCPEKAVSVAAANGTNGNFPHGGGSGGNGGTGLGSQGNGTSTNTGNGGSFKTSAALISGHIGNNNVGISTGAGGGGGGGVTGFSGGGGGSGGGIVGLFTPILLGPLTMSSKGGNGGNGNAGGATGGGGGGGGGWVVDDIMVGRSNLTTAVTGGAAGAAGGAGHAGGAGADGTVVNL